MQHELAQHGRRHGAHVQLHRRTGQLGAAPGARRTGQLGAAPIARRTGQLGAPPGARRTGQLGAAQYGARVLLLPLPFPLARSQGSRQRRRE